MLADRPIIGFSATTDPARCRAFYEGVLGLRLVADEAFALVFDAAGTMLRVQKAPAFVPLPFTQLGWRVDQIAAVIEGLQHQGVAFERYPFMEPGQAFWAAPDGAKVAWFKDPDGNLLSLTEF